MSTASVWQLVSRSEADTIALGRVIGKSLSGGDAVLVSGELGAGKTRLVQGIAAGLGTRDRPRSPTFALVNRHIGRLVLHHCDLYRLSGAREVEDLGLTERLDSGDVLTVEWPERGREALPADALEIALEQGISEDDRLVSVSAPGPRSTRVLEAARAALQAGPVEG